MAVAVLCAYAIDRDGTTVLLHLAVGDTKSAAFLSAPCWEAFLEDLKRRACPAAMACLDCDLDQCLALLRCPFVRRRQIRTTDLLERLFGEGTRRSNVIPRFTWQTSGLPLLFAVLVDASGGWRGVRMRADIAARLNQLAVDPGQRLARPGPGQARRLTITNQKAMPPRIYKKKRT